MKAGIDTAAVMLSTSGTREGDFVTFLIVAVVVIVIIFLAARKKQSAEQKRLLEMQLNFENWTNVHVHFNHAALFNLLGPRFFRVEDRLWLAQYSPTTSAFEFREVLGQGKLSGQAIICDKSVGLGGSKQESGAGIAQTGTTNFKVSPENVAEQPSSTDTATTRFSKELWDAELQMQRLNAACADPNADAGRARFGQILADSVAAQDALMLMDIAKILHKMPGSSITAFRKYRGAILAGLVVSDGDDILTMEVFRKGLLNPAASPDQWTVIPESKLNLMQEFTNPHDAALAFFVLTRSGGQAFAFSHIFRSDGDVQWTSKADFIERVAHVLVEVGVCEKAGAEASVQERSAEDFKLLNPMKPEVVALLENTPIRTSSRDKFDSNEVLQSALAIHGALGSWMQMLFAALEKGGINKEEATLQMTAMFGKMEQASKGYFPAITSLVMASTLRSYVQYLTTDEGGLNCITAELALVIIKPLFTLEDGLEAVLKEGGWKKGEIAEQFSELSKKITTVANGARPGIAPLSLAFTVDNYAKLLIKGTMNPPS